MKGFTFLSAGTECFIAFAKTQGNVYLPDDKASGRIDKLDTDIKVSVAER